MNDKKEDREESVSIGGDDATKTKRSTTRGRTTTTTLTEAVEEVKEEVKDEYGGGGGQKSSMVSPLASRSTSRRYDEHDGSRNDDDDDSKDYWETRMQPLRCVVVGVGKKGREFKKNEKKKNADATFSVDDSLSELERLCDAAGLVVVGRVTQNLRTPNARTFLGRGKN